MALNRLIAKFIYKHVYKRILRKTLKSNILKEEEHYQILEYTTKLLSLKQYSSGIGMNRQINGLERSPYIESII